MDKIVSKVELDMEELQPRIGQGGQVSKKSCVCFLLFVCLAGFRGQVFENM